VVGSSNKIYFHNDIPGDKSNNNIGCTLERDPKTIQDSGSSVNPECDKSILTTLSYDQHFDFYNGLRNRYILNTKSYTISDIDTTKRDIIRSEEEIKITEFFDNVVSPSFAELNTYLDSVITKIEGVPTDASAVKIIFDMEGSASLLNNIGSPDSDPSKYNVRLAKRRTDSLFKYAQTYINKRIGGREVSFINNSVDNIKKTIPSYNGVTLTNEDINNILGTMRDPLNPFSISSIHAADKRWAMITKTTITYTPTVEQIIKNELDQTERPKKIDYFRKRLSKLINSRIMPFHNESEYFQVLEREQPLAFLKIKDRLKFFQPAFHSTTPEGLNSRLTFLLQCTRAGNTIVKDKQQGLTNDTTPVENSIFGPPPVCVLRIGDFYHTKIVVTSINIDYDPLVWDMNPEGIGMQPMIANITMAFNYIGGQSLSQPIKELQNALSFNYFANTELYDVRSFSTGLTETELFDVDNLRDIELMNREIRKQINNSPLIDAPTQTNNNSNQINNFPDIGNVPTNIA